MARMTVDELAQAAGSKVSTLRLYQQRGLLPPPELEGRVGYYDESHLARLRVIADLQARGFSLAGIKELVDTWESGRGLQAVLGVDAGDAAPRRMTRAEVDAQFGDLVVTDEVIAAFAELGALEVRDDGTYDVNAGFLGAGTFLAAMGVSFSVMLDEFARVQSFARETSRRFVALFEQYALDGGGERASLPDDPVALAQLVQQLRALGVDVVARTMQAAIDDAAEQAIQRFAARLSAT